MAGGGRSSARETIGRVAAGAIAKKLLKAVAGVEVILRLADSALQKRTLYIFGLLHVSA